MGTKGPRARESGAARDARRDRTSTLARLAAGAARRAAHESAAGCAPLPPDLDEILAVANDDLAATAIARARTGLPGSVLREAALRYVREELHAPGATLYRRLGVAPDAPIERIREHYRELIAVFHPDRLGTDASPSDIAIATAVNEAWNTLKHPASRARYDRQCATPASATEPIVPPRAAPPWHPAAAPVPGARPPRWKRVREPGRLRTWLRSQSPRTLKALSFALLLAAAGLAVLLSAPERAPSLAIRIPDTAEAMAPSRAPLARSSTPEVMRAQATPRETPVREAAATPPAVPVPAVRPDAGRASGPTGVRPPDAAVPSPEPPQPVAAAGVAVASVERAPPEASMKIAPPPSPPLAPTVDPVRSSPPTPAEVDTLVVRFARAYEAGDFNALRELVDPDAAQDNRMALTLASFARVFRESSTRRIDLTVQERDADAERARIELAARTTLAGPDAQTHAGGGILTFVVRRRGGAPVIVDIRYRERDPA